ncbi:MAG TPA: NYN domain-containing protein [Opitutales bacterium]|jgi:ribosomal protection tetracycline resistance protein|nr:NYN domain-containing protein [Opitutales bacterium]
MPPDRHLLVDAFNVIHAWPELKAALTKFGPDAARTQLAEALRPIHDVEGWRVTIVFDGSGDEIRVERPGQELTFSYVFGPKGLSADAVIEQLVANATLPPEEDRRPRKKQKAEQEIVVATRDNLLSDATAACGARLMTPPLLRDWAETAAVRQTREVLMRSRRAANDWKSGASPWEKLNKPTN